MTARDDIYFGGEKNKKGGRVFSRAATPSASDLARARVSIAPARYARDAHDEGRDAQTI